MNFENWDIMWTLRELITRGMPEENKKAPKVNPKTGQIDLKYDPMDYDRDYFIPTRTEQLWKGAGITLDTSTILKHSIICPSSV